MMFTRFVGASIALVLVVLTSHHYWSRPVSADSSIGAGTQDCHGFSLREPVFHRLSGYNASSIHTADLNNDAIPDLVITLPEDDVVAVQLGDGTGGVLQALNHSAGDGPTDVALRDLNRDGEIDMAVTSQFSNRITILRGDGQGGFSEAQWFSTNGTPVLVEAADVDADGYVDLVVANTSSVKVFRGSRIGSFSEVTSIQLSVTGPRKLRLHDLTNDGLLDIVVSAMDGDGREMKVFIGSSSGQFTSTATLPDIYVYGFAAGDFDEDGFEDVVANDYQRSRFLFYPGTGSGTFGSPIITVHQSSFAVEAFDYDRDGTLDILTGGGALRGDGTGNFVPFASHTIGGAQNTIAIADFDSDGLEDFGLITSFGNPSDSTSISVYSPTAPERITSNAFSRQRAYDIDSADFNMDGKPDLVSSDAYSNTAWVHLQNDAGEFISTTTGGLIIGGGFNVSGFSVAVGDLNNDGIPDFAATDSFARKAVTFTGVGDGTFTRRVISILAETGTPHLVRFGHFNNDNLLDMVLLSNTSRSFSILINDGNNGFTTLPPVGVGSDAGPNKVAVGDFTNDGITDVLVSRFFDPWMRFFGGRVTEHSLHTLFRNSHLQTF